jgi:hypothetical protein
LPNGRLFACVTENIVKDTINKVSHLHSESSHSKKANIITFLGPGAVARCSLQTLSADSPMPNPVNPSPSVKFKILMVLSVGSGSGSSASLRALCFRIRKRCYRMGSWSCVKQHEKSFNIRNYEIRFFTKCGLFWTNYIKCRTLKQEKNLGKLYS